MELRRRGLHLVRAVGEREVELALGIGLDRAGVLVLLVPDVDDGLRDRSAVGDDAAAEGAGRRRRGFLGRVQLAGDDGDDADDDEETRERHARNIIAWPPLRSSPAEAGGASASAARGRGAGAGAALRRGSRSRTDRKSVVWGKR